MILRDLQEFSAFLALFYEPIEESGLGAGVILSAIPLGAMPLIFNEWFIVFDMSAWIACSDQNQLKK